MHGPPPLLHCRTRWLGQQEPGRGWWRRSPACGLLPLPHHTDAGPSEAAISVFCTILLAILGLCIGSRASSPGNCPRLGYSWVPDQCSSLSLPWPGRSLAHTHTTPQQNNKHNQRDLLVNFQAQDALRSTLAKMYSCSSRWGNPRQTADLASRPWRWSR